MFKRKKQDTRGAMPILILSENPEIKALDNRLTEIRENGDKKIEELQKVANRIAETVNGAIRSDLGGNRKNDKG